MFFNGISLKYLRREKDLCLMLACARMNCEYAACVFMSEAFKLAVEIARYGILLLSILSENPLY